MALERGALLHVADTERVSAVQCVGNDACRGVAARAASDDADAQQLIPALCRQFYQLGWVTGTGGGISVRVGERVFIAPSGVQKERIEREDLFVLDRQTQSVLQRPRNGALKPSACTPLFFNAYELTTPARASTRTPSGPCSSRWRTAASFASITRK